MYPMEKDKYMDTRKKIVEILINLLENETTKECLRNGSDLKDIKLDSLVFINMVVEIENEFNIIFEDEKLRINCFQSFDELVKYIDVLSTR